MAWKCSYEHPGSEHSGKVRVIPDEIAHGCDTLDYLSDTMKKTHLKGVESLKVSNVCKTNKSIKMDGELRHLPHNSCIFDVSVSGEMKPAPPFPGSLPRGYVHPPQECCLAPTCTVERQQKFSEDWKKGHAILPECKAKKIEGDQMREYFFKKTHPSQLLNNHKLKWSEGIYEGPQELPPSSSKDLRSCTKQNLLLRGACSDENCSEWLLNQN